MAIELADAYVSLVASGRGIAASIAKELGAPLEQAGRKAGQRTGDQIGGELKKSIAGLELAAPVIGQPKIPVPDTDAIEPAVEQAARRAAAKAADELSNIPGGIDAAEFERRVAAAAQAAAAQAKAKLDNVPVGVDVSSLASDVAAAAAKAASRGEIVLPPPEIPPPDDGRFIAGAKKAGITAGAAAGAGLTIGFVSNLGAEVSNDRLAAQLGIDEPAFARDLGRTAGRIYAGAWGESLGQVNVALRGVLQNELLDEKATNAQIESVTTKVLILADAFEQDLGATAAAAGQLLKTGMARDATEALDLIARGFQQGVDKRGDFLDTITEYGTQFRKLGIEGPRAIGLLRQGLRGGARDADIVADAFKEFSIRAVDGTELTATGFRQIGLDVRKMAAEVGKGGEAAAAAVDLTLDRLRAVPDPVLRAQAAVSLFGTQAEDLGDALFELDVSSAVAELGKIEGAAQSVGDTLGDNTASAFESLKRRAEIALGGVVGSFAPVVGGVLELAPALGGLALVGPHVVSAGKGLLDLGKSALGIGKTTEAVADLTTATRGLSGASTGIAGIVGRAAGIGAIVTGLTLGADQLLKTIERLNDVRVEVPDLQAALAGKLDIRKALGETSPDLLEKIRKDFDRLGESTIRLGSAGERGSDRLKRQLDDFDKSLAGLVAGGALETAKRRIAELAAEMGRSPDEVLVFLDNYQDALGQSTAAAATNAAAQAELDGSTSGLSRSARILGNDIADQGASFDAAAESIESYDDAMDRLIGVHVSAERAAIGHAESHQRLAESVQENGRSLDLSTEAGRSNREAILGIIDATSDHIGAMRDEGATADELRATFETHRGELARVLGQLGLNKAEADRYLGLLDAVPDSVFTKAEVDTAEATRKWTEWQALLAKTQFGNVRLPFGNGLFVPELHDGGIVPGPPGSETLALLEAGERVTAAGDVAPTTSGRGLTIENLTVDARGSDLDADDVVDALDRKLGWRAATAAYEVPVS